MYVLCTKNRVDSCASLILFIIYDSSFIPEAYRFFTILDLITISFKIPKISLEIMYKICRIVKWCHILFYLLFSSDYNSILTYVKSYGRGFSLF